MEKNSNRGVMFLFTLLLFGSLIFWPTSTASAEELYVEELETFTEDLELDTSDLPDNEELFAGYVDKMFYGTESSTFGAAGRERLNANEKFLYDYLKDCINKVADGNLASSKFTIDQETLLAWNGKGFKLFWNAEELGVDTLYTVSGKVMDTPKTKKIRNLSITTTRIKDSGTKKFAATDHILSPFSIKEV